MAGFGMDTSQVTDAAIQTMVAEQARRFHDDAPTSAAQAATIILDGVRNETWRILVGDDAHQLDRIVRANPNTPTTPTSSRSSRLRWGGGWEPSALRRCVASICCG